MINPLAHWKPAEPTPRYWISMKLGQNVYFPMVVALCLIATGCTASGGTAETPADAATSSAPPTTATTTTAPAVATVEGEAAIAVVMSAIEAKNQGDLDGWLAAFDGGVRPGVPRHAEEIRLNAGERLEILEPCQAMRPSGQTKIVVECRIRFSDDYFTLGGIVDSRPLQFNVNAAGKITGATGFSLGQRDEFNRAFHRWLEQAYPAVFNEMDPGANYRATWPGFMTEDPSQMLVALEYVGEFVAQSDIYPLEGAPSED